jgi:hypothetical protein
MIKGNAANRQTAFTHRIQQTQDSDQGSDRQASLQAGISNGINDSNGGAIFHPSSNGWARSVFELDSIL